MTMVAKVDRQLMLSITLTQLMHLVLPAIYYLEDVIQHYECISKTKSIIFTLCCIYTIQFTLPVQFNQQRYYQRILTNNMYQAYAAPVTTPESQAHYSYKYT